eukprot:4655919-Amphidinium_carterae.1
MAVLNSDKLQSCPVSNNWTQQNKLVMAVQDKSQPATPKRLSLNVASIPAMSDGIGATTLAKGG